MRDTRPPGAGPAAALRRPLPCHVLCSATAPHGLWAKVTPREHWAVLRCAALRSAALRSPFLSFLIFQHHHTWRSNSKSGSQLSHFLLPERNWVAIFIFRWLRLRLLHSGKFQRNPGTVLCFGFQAVIDGAIDGTVASLWIQVCGVNSMILISS